MRSSERSCSKIDYFHSLDQTSKSRYLKKLAILGLDEKYDPYATCNNGNFEDNMAFWPQVEFRHIFCYFIEWPGVYTKQELLQWKTTITLRAGMLEISLA